MPPKRALLVGNEKKTGRAKASPTKKYAMFILLNKWPNYNNTFFVYRSSRSWSAEECESLVNEISKYPSLYQTSHPDYLRSDLKAEVRVKIAALFPNCGKHSHVMWNVLVKVYNNGMVFYRWSWSEGQVGPSSCSLHQRKESSEQGTPKWNRCRWTSCREGQVSPLRIDEIFGWPCEAESVSC